MLHVYRIRALKIVEKLPSRHTEDHKQHVEEGYGRHCDVQKNDADASEIVEESVASEELLKEIHLEMNLFKQKRRNKCNERTQLAEWHFIAGEEMRRNAAT